MVAACSKGGESLFIKKSYDKEAKMDPTYLLLLIFGPVPVVLIYAIIVNIYDRKKKSNFICNHLQSKKIPTKSTGSGNQKMGQPSAS